MDPMRRNAIMEASIQQPLGGPSNLVHTCRADPFDRTCTYLAESYEVNADFTVWTFKVRDDIVWHDGTPFTAEDVRFWYDLMLNGHEGSGRSPSRFHPQLGAPTSVKVLAGNVLEVTLSISTPNYPITLGDDAMSILHPKHLTLPELEKGNGGVAPPDIGYVGVGPFVFESYDKGSVIKIRRNDNYFEKDKHGDSLPYLDGIDYPIITDREAMVAAFRAGRVDATGRGGKVEWLPEQVNSVKKDMGDSVIFHPIYYSGRTFGFDLVTGPAIFKDIRVRRAITLALDRQDGASFYGEAGKIQALWFPDSPWINEDYLTWPGWNPATKQEDIAEAKRLLAEAGHADGFKIHLPCRNSSTWQVECEIFAEQMRENLNIQVDLEIVDNTTLGEIRCDGGYDMVVNGGAANYLFPDTGFGNAASVSVNPCSLMRHDDQHVDDIFAKIQASTDFDERVKLTREVEKYIVKDQVMFIPTWIGPLTFASRTYVKGLLTPVSAAENYLDHTNVWLDK
jgi:peptide/nickel transport system substrate-binding protein